MAEERRDSEWREDDEVADREEPTSFFSMKNLAVGQVNMVAGTLNGYSIGFVGVYSNLYGLSTNCAQYKNEKPCTTLSNSKCEWFANPAGESYCKWRNVVSCEHTYKTAAECGADSNCAWSYGDKKCTNPSGYNDMYSGIFAGAMIVGCLIGSMFAGPIAKRLGPKVSFFIVGAVSAVCSVLYHIATGINQFWLLCAARLIVGLVLGLVCVAAPLYVSEHASPKYSKMIGVLFQVFTTLGIFLAALVGLLAGQTVKFDSSSDQHLSGRMQALCAVSTFLSALMILLGIFLKGSKHTTEVDMPKSDDEPNVNEKQYTYLQMIGPLIMGVVVAGTLQLTGINAVMNYAPTIMSNLSLAPLVGNLIVMLWNFVTTIASIPLASVFTMRQLFLAGSLITSVCCLFLCGIPVYPDVSKTAGVKNGVAITGILIFIAAFECGVGPCFYVLAQDLFPPSFRPKGSSFTMLAQFIFNVIINVCYPIATKSISGGDAGDQNKGQAIAFIFFGCVGLVCFVLQIFFLHPWDEGEAQAAIQANNNNATERKENYAE